MSKSRTRDPDESSIHKGAKKDHRGIWEAHVDARGRTWNGRTNKPVMANREEANAIKHANGPRFPGADGPSPRSLAIIQSGAILRPQQIAGVRQSIVNVVEENISRARQVLAGEERWTAPQTSLFLGLLHKVAPNMSENLHRHTMQPAGTDYAKLSRVELQAALDDVLNDAKVIEAVRPEKPKRQITPETRARMKRGRKRTQLSIKATRARILETKTPTVLPPLTREEDDRKRNALRRSVSGARKGNKVKAAQQQLRDMASMDPLVLPAMDPPSEPE